MKVNKKTDLAIRILKHLYINNQDQYQSGNIIAQDLDISYHHLRRIVPILNELGYTTSKQGKDGGIKLTERASTISIEQLLLKTEANQDCINDCNKCIFKQNCTFESHTQKAVKLFCNYFANIYIQDL